VSRPNVPLQLVIPGVARRARVARKGRRPRRIFRTISFCSTTLPALCRDDFMAPAAVTSFCDPWVVKVGIEELFQLCPWPDSTCQRSAMMMLCEVHVHRRWFLTLTLYAIADTVVFNLVAVNARRWCCRCSTSFPLERTLIHTVRVSTVQVQSGFAVALFGSGFRRQGHGQRHQRWPSEAWILSSEGNRTDPAEAHSRSTAVDKARQSDAMQRSACNLTETTVR
jgi:hypothetical protein